MWLEISLPDGFDSPGIASLHISCTAIGDKRDACICIFWRLAPAALKTSHQCGQCVLCYRVCTLHPSCPVLENFPLSMHSKIAYLHAQQPWK